MPLKNRTEEEGTKVLLEIEAEYQIKGRQIKQLVFDCEPNTLTANRIQLLFKAAGQKVGLVEVSIRLIRENARATMAVVRKQYGYMPPNQFNMDLCLDSISVLNRIPTAGCTESPHGLFTGRCTDVMQDFLVD